MYKNLAHVCINVKDINRTIEFYSEKMGLPIMFTFEKNGKKIGAYFKISDSNFIEAFEKKDLQGINTGIVHFCIEVDDIDQFMREMRKKEIECSEKKMGCDHSWQTWLSDPDGNRFEIHQYTAESAQITGQTVEIDW